LDAGRHLAAGSEGKKIKFEPETEEETMLFMACRNVVRTSLFPGAAIIAALSIAPCAAAEDTRDIDIVMPLTGSGSFLGKGEQVALQLAEKFINDTGGIHGQQLHLNFHDDQSSPQVAVQLANGILASHAAVVIGSSLVAMCNAMAPLMRDGPVMYCLSPGIHPPAGGYIFTSNVSTSDLIAAQLRYFRERGWKRIALLTSTDASGQDAEREFTKDIAVAENHEMKLVHAARFNPTDVSADAQIQTIKGSDPQALIAWTSGTSLGTVFKSIVRAGLDLPIATSNSNMNRAQMAQYADFTPPQLFIASSNWLPTQDTADILPEVQKAKNQFYAAFKQAGISPDNSSALAWDPAIIVTTGLRTLKPGATAADLRTWLSSLKDFPGAVGYYDFAATPQRGLDESSVMITQWQADASTWKVVSHPKGMPL
jgi:branched-chain amino acid transport system substrate-binding protein